MLFRSYFMTIVEVATRYVWTYLIRTKAASRDVIQRWAMDVRKEFGDPERLKGTRFRSDNGGEYTGKIFDKILAEIGMKDEKTEAYNPQSNGIAEGCNQRLLPAMRAVLRHSRRPLKLWGTAVKHVTEV